MDNQEFWNEAYKNAKNKGYGAKTALRIANSAVANYHPVVSGSRSISVDSNFYNNEGYLDILVGYPDSGVEEGLPDALDPSGWQTFQEKSVKADLEHFNSDFADGIANDLDEKWQNFMIDAKLYKKGNEIRAKITPPDTDLGKEFIDKYKAGEFGTSIEYRGKQYENTIKDWEITGFSFTKNPHYDKTRPKNTEN